MKQDSRETENGEPIWTPPQFTLRDALLATALLALFLGMGLWIGFPGIAIAYDAVILAVCIPKGLGIRQIGGLAVPKVTVVEWGVVLAIAVLLHAQFLPAVDVP